MADHDQRFKTLLPEFFPLYAQLFHANWLAVLDLARVEWLQQEVFLDPPHGKKLSVDLVARVATLQPVPPLRPGEEAAGNVLVHLEVESEDRLTDLRGRLYDYHKQLRNRYHVPVLSAGLYLRVALQGQGTDAYEESFLGMRTRIEWPYVGLPGLDAEQYLQGNNILGVALSVLMRIAPERRVWLAAEAMRRIVASQESQRRQFLLGECVLAYGLPDAEAREAFRQLIQSDPYREVQTMTKTWFDEVRDEGRLQERRRIARKVLEKKFGPLAPAVVERFETLPEERLENLVMGEFDAATLEELGLGEAGASNGQNGG